VRSASLRQRRRADEDDEEFDRPAGRRPWWWRTLLRRPRDTLACMIAGGAAIAIIVNGVYLQHGPHPAPIFAIKPLPVATARDTVGSLQRPRAVEPEVAKHDVPAAHARPAVVELPRPRPASAPAAAPARKDPIAELLARTQAQPNAPQPPVHQAVLAAPQPIPQPPIPQPPAPAPVPVPAPSRSLAQPSRQVLAVQRALSDFGYGQLKPTGIFDAETKVAIQQFQRSHNLPVTGELNDPVKRELVNMIGHDLD
jgi:peptidoglycan hydrolase-like protein with peptidoglycan-binding domain